MRKLFIIVSLFPLNLCCNSRVLPTETPILQKRETIFTKICHIATSFSCCKSAPVLVEKPPTGWGYSKKLTHKRGSLPKGWRRASSHDPDED